MNYYHGKANQILDPNRQYDQIDLEDLKKQKF